MGMDLLLPGALVSNTTERSANASVVSASLALAAYPDEDDEVELLDDELFEEELLEEELLEDELEDDEPEVPPHPLSTTANATSAKFKDFIFRSKRPLFVWVNYPLAPNGLQSRLRYAIHVLRLPRAINDKL